MTARTTAHAHMRVTTCTHTDTPNNVMYTEWIFVFCIVAVLATGVRCEWIDDESGIDQFVFLRVLPLSTLYDRTNITVTPSILYLMDEYRTPMQEQGVPQLVTSIDKFNRGRWVNGTLYDVGDVVQMDELLYICKVPNTGEVPFTNSVFWVAIVVWKISSGHIDTILLERYELVYHEQTMLMCIRPCCLILDRIMTNKSDWMSLHSSNNLLGIYETQQKVLKDTPDSQRNPFLLFYVGGMLAESIVKDIHAVLLSEYKHMISSIDATSTDQHDTDRAECAELAMSSMWAYFDGRKKQK